MKNAKRREKMKIRNLDIVFIGLEKSLLVWSGGDSNKRRASKGYSNFIKNIYEDKIYVLQIWWKAKRDVTSVRGAENQRELHMQGENLHMQRVKLTHVKRKNPHTRRVRTCICEEPCGDPSWCLVMRVRGRVSNPSFSRGEDAEHTIRAEWLKCKLAFTVFCDRWYQHD